MAAKADDFRKRPWQTVKGLPELEYAFWTVGHNSLGDSVNSDRVVSQVMPYTSKCSLIVLFIHFSFSIILSNLFTNFFVFNSFVFHSFCLFKQSKIHSIISCFAMCPVQRKVENKTIPVYITMLLKILFTGVMAQC